MLTWGEIRIGYYLLIVLLLWLFNGTPSAIFTGLLIGLWMERDFKRWVFHRFGIADADGAVGKAMQTAKTQAVQRGKANDAADTKTAKPKAASKPKTTKAKPKVTAGAD